MPARNPLPAEERDFLALLAGEDLEYRLLVLSSAGWSLQAIGDALDPQVPRSTVHVWVQNAARFLEPRTFAQPIPRILPPHRVLTTSPGIPAPERTKISTLAPLARRYRSKTSPHSAYAQANQELTEICTALYERGVPVQEIAKAAGVTYRAMLRRIEKA
jgi:hypothetical protein